ncbi:lys-63-specific deubiquitinase BRCC36-like [Stegodyphus dumicola]|uniref:lys-63-specific deubiquitinase BRCC36-like n=1 Tax=Stegodyphus dumicola TaxID=202533 RepID=UPI0015B072ED|nr:lys-63-specific deubiquitinase BRCC36-like [Stegodyphus dumicola]
MSLAYVNLATDVYFVCLNHALSTEGEEIVGLLVGEVDENRVAHISAVVILRRSDKRKDRVEISPEQLSNASTEAERLACILKRPIRVIGWYHSHPKLTVWPSPIDVNTQDSYQMMDDGFIGMIFSVFNEDPSKKGGRIQMTCYQSQTVIEDSSIEKRRLDVPIRLVPANYISNVCMNALIQLPRYLCQEEQLAYQVTNQMQLDYLTRLHNSSVYLRSMGQIAEVICGPLLKMLEERILNNEIKRKKLQNKKKELATVLEQIYKENARSRISESAVSSPGTGKRHLSPPVSSEDETQTSIAQAEMTAEIPEILNIPISPHSVSDSLDPENSDGALNLIPSSQMVNEPSAMEMPAASSNYMSHGLSPTVKDTISEEKENKSPIPYPKNEDSVETSVSTETSLQSISMPNSPAEDVP